MSTSLEPSTLDPAAYRGDFPILETVLHGGVPLVYLDNAATSQRPRQVIQAIVDTYEHHYANVHRGIHWLADQTTELPWRFEAGTPPIVPAIGLGAAIDYLNTVGMDAIHRHERLLTEHAHRVLAGVEGVRIYGPSPEHKGGIVSFTLKRIHAHDVAQLLDRHGVAVRAGHHCAMPLHKRFGISATTRASFYFYNTLAEIDRLGEALERVKGVFRRGREA